MNIFIFILKNDEHRSACIRCNKPHLLMFIDTMKTYSKYKQINQFLYWTLFNICFLRFFSEGLPGFIFLRFISSMGFIRIYLFNRDLLGFINCIKIFVHPQSMAAPSLSPSVASSPSPSLLPSPSPSKQCGIY